MGKKIVEAKVDLENIDEVGFTVYAESKKKLYEALAKHLPLILTTVELEELPKPFKDMIEKSGYCVVR